MSETVSLSEACAVLGLEAEHLGFLTAGPFTPASGRLTIRQLLGIHVMLALPMVDTMAALGIADAAANDAREDGVRILAIGWATGKPSACWVDGIPSELARPVLAVPAERLLTELTARLAAFRGAATRPN